MTGQEAAIRDALNANVLTIRDDGTRSDAHEEALAALAALVAERDAWEKRAETAWEQMDKASAEAMSAHRKAAQAVAERDKWMRADSEHVRAARFEQIRANKAVDERDRYREALRSEIEKRHYRGDGKRLTDAEIDALVVAALAAGESE